MDLRAVGLCIVALCYSVSACSDHAQKETREAADAVAADAKAGAARAADATKEAGQAVADAAHRTAEGAKDAAIAVGEAGSDTWITAKLKVKFADESMLKQSAIDVSTTNHVVTLTGRVPSAPAKARAEEIARGTEGVSKVLNQINVKGPGGC